MKIKNPNIESLSLTALRLRKFRSLKRGYYSFLLILFCYLISYILPLFVGRDALIVNYNENYYYPLFKYYSASVFSQNIPGEANYRLLKKQFADENSGNWVLLPLYPYSPNENLLDEMEGTPPHKPSASHFFGTDDRGRDVFSRLLYGFNISISFALIVTFFSFFAGTLIGALCGFFAGKFDLLTQRFIEIWSTLPFLYVMIIVSSILQPNFLILTFILSSFGWMGITFYIRGEFYREKSKDYVTAAVSMGTPVLKIMAKHILPNSLTPIISFAPFAIVGNISVLIALDFLGFGVPPPTPSWGELMQQGMQDISNWWLTAFPLLVEFLTLLAIVFIGESIREAFDPKEYSRLR